MAISAVSATEDTPDGAVTALARSVQNSHWTGWLATGDIVVTCTHSPLIGQLYKATVTMSREVDLDDPG